MKMRSLVMVAALAAWGMGCSSDSADNQPTPNGGTGGAGGSGGQGGNDDGNTELPDGCSVLVEPSDDDYATIQSALLDAKSGDVICFAKGRYEPKDELSLAVSGVTLRGLEGSVLDFTKQEFGKNGLHVTANDTLIDGLRIENTPGDGIRATAVEGLTIRNVHIEWTWGPKTENGGYAIYPVQSSKILIEDSFVSGASDTGIYVGQSNQIIVRRNKATNNVAGIEIENSTDADVYDNHLYGNTSGILVFNLPGLEVKDGKRAKVHDNLIEDNNLANFAAKGNIVAIVPSGTGILVMAADENEIHDNTIKKHQSIGIGIVGWGMTGKETDDEEYDWYSEGNYTHGNTIEESGYDPQGDAEIIAVLLGKEKLEDMVWDGESDSEKDNSDNSLTNCFAKNGDATFLNILEKSTDIEPNTCEHSQLPSVEL